jgi:hypothetical protein
MVARSDRDVDPRLPGWASAPAEGILRAVIRPLACLLAAALLPACGARTGLPVPPYTGPRVGCADAGVPSIFMMSADSNLLSFTPADASSVTIGAIRCPSPSSPNSMAVDREGIAYVNFLDGSLFRLDTTDASCTATPYLPGQGGFLTFGMSYASDTYDPYETLYVGDDTQGNPGSGLASIDTSSFVLSYIGPFAADLGGPTELAGTGDGRLYAFAPDSPDGPRVSQVDKTSGASLSDTVLPASLANAEAFAFAYFDGDFYLFTAQSGGTDSQVTLFRPSDGSATAIGTVPATIVGVGVSTCAP